MKTKPAPSHREIFISLLRQASEQTDSTNQDRRNTVLAAELIDEGFLKGDVNRGINNYVATATVGITIKGRLFLDRLVEEELGRSTLGKVQKWVLLIIGFLGGGIVAPVVVEFLKSWILQP